MAEEYIVTSLTALKYKILANHLLVGAKNK